MEADGVHAAIEQAFSEQEMPQPALTETEEATTKEAVS